MRKLSYQVITFTEENLLEEIRKASFAPSETDAFFQSSYLASYLSNKESGARTFIIEQPYVDRYFLEEYTRFYSTALHPPCPKATRLHFFSLAFNSEQFDNFIIDATKGKYDEVCAYLSSIYLGFVVVRPLPSAPIGRTILSTFKSEKKDRCYALPPSPYNVHLAGLKLSVRGIPFQQQEQAVGACATTAIWSALSRIVRTDGGRAPTPFAVTEAATKHYIWDRAFPAASGLKDEQIMEAVRQFGYSPLYIEPKHEREMFIMAIKCYIRSGIPVILKISDKNEKLDAHAVTIIGFSEYDSEDFFDHIDLKVSESHILKSLSLRRIYVHDDRLGPYARAELIYDSDGIFTKYVANRAGFEKFGNSMTIWNAIIPLYPKMRLTAFDMIGFASEVLPFMKSVVGTEAAERLRVDFRFALSGDYLKDLLHAEFHQEKKAFIVKNAVLSRYVGIIEFYAENDLIAHFVCDTTDIRRDVPKYIELLAVITKHDEDRDKVNDYIKKYASNVLVA